MYHGQKPPLRTTVILPNGRAKKALVAGLSSDPRLRVVADFESLASAYASTEAAPPDLVVCSKKIAHQAEFAMFEALIGITGGKIVAVHATGGAATVIRALGLPAHTQAVASPPPAMIAPVPQKLVAIGSSTGGIEALSQILSAYPVNCPPTVIVQHIRPDFLDSVVDRLNRVCSASVQAATEGHRLQPGQVLFAPGVLSHLEVDAKSLLCHLRDGPAVSGHQPSIDILFKSIAAHGPKAVGVLLTGMGRDGATGLGEMRRAGAWTISQDAATSTVYGMPRVADEEHASCDVLPLPRIGKAILAAAAKRSQKVHP